MDSKRVKAIHLLELAQHERDLGWNEYHMFGRSLAPYLEIARSYETIAARTLGEEYVKQYVLEHGEFMTMANNRIMRVFHKKG